MAKPEGWNGEWQQLEYTVQNMVILELGHMGEGSTTPNVLVMNGINSDDPDENILLRGVDGKPSEEELQKYGRDALGEGGFGKYACWNGTVSFHEGCVKVTGMHYGKPNKWNWDGEIVLIIPQDKLKGIIMSWDDVVTKQVEMWMADGKSKAEKHLGSVK